MVIAKIVLYGIYIIFMMFTLLVLGSMFYNMLMNIITSPYYCNCKVVSKNEEYRVMPNRSQGVFVIVYVLELELPNFKRKKFKIKYDDYFEILEDKEYRFYIKNNEVKEYMDLDVC